MTVADVDAAKELLIQRQDTHLDSLAERLREVAPHLVPMAYLHSGRSGVGS